MKIWTKIKNNKKSQLSNKTNTILEAQEPILLTFQACCFSYIEIGGSGNTNKVL